MEKFRRDQRAESARACKTRKMEEDLGGGKRGRRRKRLKEKGRKKLKRRKEEEKIDKRGKKWQAVL